MSNVDSCIKIAIVPNSPEKALIGPFILSNGDSEGHTLKLAHKLGYKDGEFELREIIYPEDLLT